MHNNSETAKSDLRALGRMLAESQRVSVAVSYVHFAGTPGLVGRRHRDRSAASDELSVQSVNISNIDADHAAGDAIA
jgi:hypothetical protein